MIFQHVGDEFVPARRVGKIFPRRNLRRRMQRFQTIQLIKKQLAIIDQMRVFLAQQLRPQRCRRDHLKTSTLPHALDERLRYAQVADLFAFRFHIHRARRIEARQQCPDAAFE